MMLKKSRVKFLESEIVTYPTTQMMRNLLVAQVCAQIDILDTDPNIQWHVEQLHVLGFLFEIRWLSQARSCVWWRPTWRAVKAKQRSGWSSCEWRCRGWGRHLTTSPSCLEGTQTWGTLRSVICLRIKKFACSEGIYCPSNVCSSLFMLRIVVISFTHTSLIIIFPPGLHLRSPRWVCPPVSAMSGSGWESRSTAATHGTPKPTTTRQFPTSVAAASTGSTSARLPRMASHAWPQTTWPWWGWRSWTVNASLAITGGSTVASPLRRNARTPPVPVEVWDQLVLFFLCVLQTLPVPGSDHRNAFTVTSSEVGYLYILCLDLIWFYLLICLLLEFFFFYNG